MIAAYDDEKKETKIKERKIARALRWDYHKLQYHRVPF